MRIISFYTENYKDIGEINAHRWETYCQRYGYEWTCPTPISVDIHPYWQKIHYISWALQSDTDIVVWTDIDIVVRDMEFDISDIGYLSNRFILVSSDQWGLCAGFMFIRNTAWSKSFFSNMLFLGDMDEQLQKKKYTRLLRDQNTIRYLCEGFPSVQKNIYLIDEGIISCPETVEAKAPMHHFWANGGNARRQKMISELAGARRQKMIGTV